MTLHELLDLTKTYIQDIAGEKVFDSTLVRYFNSAIKDFCLNTRIFRTKINFNSVAGQSEYDLKAADGTEILKVDYVLYDKSKLSPMTPAKLFSTEEFKEDSQGTPLVFTSFNAQTIMLYPIPSEDGKSIDIYGRGLPATANYFDKSNLTGESPISQEWDMALVFYAATQVSLSTGDRMKAKDFQAEYAKQILMALRKDKRTIPYRYSFYPEEV